MMSLSKHALKYKEFLEKEEQYMYLDNSSDIEDVDDTECDELGR